MISSTSCYPFSIALNTLEIAIAFAFGCGSQSYDRQGAESTDTMLRLPRRAFRVHNSDTIRHSSTTRPMGSFPPRLDSRGLHHTNASRRPESVCLNVDVHVHIVRIQAFET